MNRGSWQWLIIGLALVAGSLFLWFGWFAPIQSHIRWHSRVQSDIRALAHTRPAEVSKGQWEFIVGWTLNLHCNCGSDWYTVEPEWRDGFAAELERRLQGPIALSDIEWIWDEYAGHTKYGPTYSDRYRPTQAEGLLQASEGCFGIRVD
jgi:hypothetical protein